MDYEERVRTTLAECWKWHAGLGGCSLITERLGVNKNYITEMLRLSDGPKIRALGRVIVELGEDEMAFFRRVYALKAPQSDPLALLAALPHKQRERPQIQALINAAKRIVATGSREDLRGRAANIEEAEELRRREPTRSAEVAHAEALQARSWPLFCKAVGAFGAACRVGGRLELAGRAAWLALRMADRIGAGELTRVEMLAKAAYVLAAHGHYQKALMVSSSISVSSHESPIHFARSLVDNGLFQYYNDFFEGAAQSFEAALAHREALNPFNRALAHQGLAEILARAGDLERARENMMSAKAILPEWAIYDHARLDNTFASMKLRVGDFSGAELLHRSARDTIIELNPYDGALFTLDLIDVFLAQGRCLDAVSEALNMVRLLQPFEGNIIASGAIHEFIRIARHGSVDSAAIEQARKALAKARARPYVRARRVP